MATMAVPDAASLPPDIDRQTSLEAAIWTQISVSFLFILLRFWARSIRKSVAADDWWMLATWISFLVTCATLQLGAQRGGTRHFLFLNPEVQQYQLKWIVLFLTFGIVTTLLSKIAVGMTMLRIIGSSSPWRRYVIWLVLALMTLISVADFGFNLFRCGNPRAQWDYEIMMTDPACIPRSATNPINHATNAVLVFADWCFSILPMAIVWGLQMPKRKKIVIIILLGLTIIAGAAGAVKLVAVTHLDLKDVTWTSYDGKIWYGIETMFTIVFGSAPTLRPLWDNLFRLLNSSVGSSEHTSGIKQERYIEPQYMRQVSSSRSEESQQAIIYNDAPSAQEFELAHLVGYSQNRIRG